MFMPEIGWTKGYVCIGNRDSQAILPADQSAPDRFVGIANDLIPKDLALTVCQYCFGLDQTDMALLKALRAELPTADSMTPAEAFEYAREALRAAKSKPTRTSEARCR